MLEVQPSGYYAWIQQPVSGQHQANQQLSGMIKQSWLESGGVYGYRKIHSDLRDMGLACGVNRVHRLMKLAGIKAQVGYRAPRCCGGESHVISPHRLQRQFNPAQPDRAWVTDITYIRTHEGWLYLAVVLDLFSRRVIGWSMQPRITKDLVLNALLMAVAPTEPSARCARKLDIRVVSSSLYPCSMDFKFAATEAVAGNSTATTGFCHLATLLFFTF